MSLEPVNSVYDWRGGFFEIHQQMWFCDFSPANVGKAFLISILPMYPGT